MLVIQSYFPFYYFEFPSLAEDEHGNAKVFFFFFAEYGNAKAALTQTKRKTKMNCKLEGNGHLLISSAMLIPGLIKDVATLILLKVPYSHHWRLKMIMKTSPVLSQILVISFVNFINRRFQPRQILYFPPPSLLIK